MARKTYDTKELRKYVGNKILSTKQWIRTYISEPESVIKRSTYLHRLQDLLNALPDVRLNFIREPIYSFVKFQPEGTEEYVAFDCEAQTFYIDDRNEVPIVYIQM